MSNFLTGDFDAVVQVSRGTVNRLLATTHQNKKGYSKKMPLSPQKLVSRIGGYESVNVGEGQVRGTAWVRISVPTIEIEFTGNARMRIPASVSPALAAAVVAALARR